MELETVFLKRIQKNRWWQAGQPVVVAVSAGVDSMVLLTLLEQLPKSVRPQIIVAHVNHQLRQPSDSEQAFLEQYCVSHKLTFESTTWDLADHPTHGLEQAARDFRYAFFEQVMNVNGAQVLLTAHHQDDQVETVLMKLIRGGDLTQLTGIALARAFGDGQLIRPLLATSKTDLQAYANQHKITWFEDATNQESMTLRNELRNQIIPDLTQLNSQFKQHVLDYSHQLTELLTLADAAVLQAYQRVFTADEGKISTWRQLDGPARMAILKRYLTNHGVASKQKQLAEISQLLENPQRPQGEIDLGHNLLFFKRYGVFFLKNKAKHSRKCHVTDVNVVVSKRWVSLTKTLAMRLVSAAEPLQAGNHQMTVSLSTEELPLRVMAGQPDDVLALKNGGHKRLRRLLIDHKVPHEKRTNPLVVKTALGEVLWVLGIQRAWRVTQPAALQYQIQLRNDEIKGEVDE